MSDTLEKINALLAMMKENEVVELELQEGDFSVTLRKQGAFPPPPPTVSMPGMMSLAGMPGLAGMMPPPPPPAPAPAPVTVKENDPALVPVKSPIVGTFSRSPSPESAPFVQEGDVVKKDAVVCIIEAMKIMNEIRAEMDGRIEKVLVESGEPVEYGQPLFLLRKG